MAKTVKYEMYINTSNIMGPVVPITKKQFDAFIKGFRKEIKENHTIHEPDIVDDENIEDNEFYCPDITEEMVEDTDKYTKTRYVFNDSNGPGSECVMVCFVKHECKPGYHWK